MPEGLANEDVDFSESCPDLVGMAASLKSSRLMGRR